MTTAPRQPAIFISHGGGPCFWMTFPEPIGAHGFDRLRDNLAGLLDRLPTRPSAILLVTAHWEEPVATVSVAASPPMLFDYYNFPEHTYRLNYPAPGAPELARRVRGLLAQAGLSSAEDSERGFDHGVFVPMLIVDPEAKIPVAMMSLRGDLDPAHHLAIGAALAPLRDENVLIIGSGNSFHNLRRFQDGRSPAVDAFDEWLTQTVSSPQPEVRAARLRDWSLAPGARDAQPREDHLLPLMVVAGAAGDDVGRLDFHDRVAGKPSAGYVFG